ncbi:phosphatase [Enterococcus florum]|uniref:Phosphatase n=1 Tax=Enterococcus florum TaxID=2480627 RepID=A0A4P5PNZ1_9ENTE|nr:HAD family hydrolase [Enterococcus florum]GCF94863.1 phosphatase [Enterococcus florum]
MIKTILFDVDGTLIDTEYVSVQSLKETLKEERNLTLSDKELEFSLGIPGARALERFTDSPEEIEQLLASWMKRMREYTHHARLFNGILELLQELKQLGYRLGVVTSKLRSDAVVEFAAFGLNTFFDVIITADDTPLHKPNPEPLLKALEELNADNQASLYIGDSLYDMLCAESSGVDFLLARWGAKEKPEFSRAAYQLETPADLLPYLKGR